MDADNRGTSGGSNRVDDVDEVFALWFAACNCLTQENAECSTDAAGAGCVSKLGEVNDRYMERLDNVMPAFSQQGASSCPKSAPRPDRDIGAQCAKLIPNYVAPTEECVATAVEHPASVFSNPVFNDGSSFYGNVPAFALDGDEGTHAMSDYNDASSNVFTVTVAANTEFDQVLIWPRDQKHHRYDNMLVTVPESGVTCSPSRVYTEALVTAIFDDTDADASLIFNCDASVNDMSAVTLTVSNANDYTQIAEIRVQKSAVECT